MPSYGETRYSRDETVKAVRDHFIFLSKMYLDYSEVQEAPAGGWPEITTEEFRDCGKTDTVIDLLRHLPYINGAGDNPHFAAHAPFANYLEAAKRGCDSLRDEMKWTEEDYEEDIPPHVIGLAKGNRQCPVILLDTKLGMIYWVQCYEEIRDQIRIYRDGRTEEPPPVHYELSDDGGYDSGLGEENDSEASDHGSDHLAEEYSGSEESSSDDGDSDEGNGSIYLDPEIIEQVRPDYFDAYAPENEHEWRGASDTAAWAVPDFFDMLKVQFLQLTFVPLSRTRVLPMGDTFDPRGQAEMDRARAIWKAHGWPRAALEDGNFDKSRCLDELFASSEEAWMCSK